MLYTTQCNAELYKQVCCYLGCLDVVVKWHVPFNIDWTNNSNEGQSFIQIWFIISDGHVFFRDFTFFQQVLFSVVAKLKLCLDEKFNLIISKRLSVLLSTKRSVFGHWLEKIETEKSFL